jgi:hypothetical protein
VNRFAFWRPPQIKKRRTASVRLQLELLEARNLLSSTSVIDVVGHLPAAEYNQFIAGALNFQGNPYKDWGNEPSIAINPLNPNQIAIATFAYGTFVPPETTASLWYSTDGGADWGIRFPINAQPAPGQYVPNDQVIAYDSKGVLHGAFLTYANSKNDPQLNVFYGSTADPTNADGVNGRPATVWQWNPNRVNLYPQSLNLADQPWLALGNGHAYVAYSAYADGRGNGSVEVRVSASADNGATFTTDNNIDSTSNNGSLSIVGNPGARLATDQLGNVYSLYGWGEPPFPDASHPLTTVHYRLNMSSDGGQTWKFSSFGGKAGGLDVDDGQSLQLGTPVSSASFGGVNRLTGNITAIAADPTGAHIYAVYGKEDGSGVDRIWLAEFHPDGQGGLMENANPVALSVPGQRSALPSAAVTANGAVFVQYDTFDGTEFHVHLATSTDFGQTFTDQDLYDFTATGIPFAFPGQDRLLGDYQFLTAVGNNVYGAFAGRGNVVDPNKGIDTTGYMDPFFFTAAAPRVGTPATEASALVAVPRVNPASASSAVQPFILPAAAGTAPAAPLPGSATPTALTPHQSRQLPASGTSSMTTAKATDAVFAASHTEVDDDGAWLFAPLSPNSLDAI